MQALPTIFTTSMSVKNKICKYMVGNTLQLVFCINIDLWSKKCVYANKKIPITKLLISKYHEYI